MARVSYKNDQNQDERLDPYSDNARDLYQQEQDAYDQQFDDIAQNETNNDFNNIAQNEGGGTEKGNDASDTSKNIDATKKKEEGAGGNWETNVSGNDEGAGGKKSPATFWQQAKKKGPMGTIIALVGGGGIIGGGMLSPAGALIHVKEVLVEKFDTMSSVVEERYILIMGKRMFSTNATCKVKVRCKYSGITNRQMERLRVQGADVVDKDGKPVTRNKLGRFTGGVHLVMPDGTKISARDYRSALRSNPTAREISRKVFAPRYLSWNDKISKEIRAKKRLVTNPDWGDGDEKEARKSVFRATSGDAYTAQEQDNQKTVEDEDGKKVKEDGSKIDFGDATEQINEASDNLKEKAVNGELIDPIPADPAGAAVMPETEVKSSAFKQGLAFLNPADFLVGLCTTYQLTSILVLTAKTIALANAMRYASQFLSTADKIKAGEATSTDAEQAMTILQRENQYGESFGDATGYQYPQYGSVPDTSIASSAAGNGVVLVLSAALRWVNGALGKGTVVTGCRILTNPVVQGALALTSFIPGGGQAIKGVTSVITTTAKAVANHAIKEAVEKIVKDIAAGVTKDALKERAKEVTKEFVKMAASVGGMFLAGYLLQRYAIPYLARIISGTENTGSEDGVTAMDTMANGFDATNQVTAMERGLQPLGKDDVAAFREFNDQSTAVYVADMRAQSNPFDVNDPYSVSNALASSLYTFTSKLKNSSILSAPSAILSAFNPLQLIGGSTAKAAETSYCDDEYLNGRKLAASPFCNVVMGHTDVEMVQTADPDTSVLTYMLDNKQIDEEGNPIDGSAFKKYVDECVTDAGDKQYTDLGDETTQLPATCSDLEKNRTTERKMFSLYLIDNNTTDAMDTPLPKDTEEEDTKYIAVGNIPEAGTIVGASVFGGKLEGGKWVEYLADNGGNDLGNKNNHMTGVSAFAELDMGNALGNIPDGTRLEIEYNGKKVIASKEDIGAGGPDVKGHKRAVDLWWQTANALGFNTGTDVIKIRAVSPGTELTPVSSINAGNRAIGFTIGNLIPFTTSNILKPGRSLSQ